MIFMYFKFELLTRHFQVLMSNNTIFFKHIINTNLKQYKIF